MDFFLTEGKESEMVVVTADMKPTADPSPSVISIRKNRTANSWGRNSNLASTSG